MVTLLLLGLLNATPLRIAVLPPADSAGAVATVREVAGRYGLAVDTLTPEQMVDPAVFSPRRYPLAVQVGAERYLYTVSQRGDAAAATLRYLDQGGTLLVGGFVWPFYRAFDWRDGLYQRSEVPPDPGFVPDAAYRAELERMGQQLTGTFNFALGLPVSRGGTTQFEAPDEPVRFERVAERFVDELPRVVDWSDGEQRFRPVSVTEVPQGAKARALYQLRGEGGRDYGPGAAVVEYETGPLAPGAVVYLWAQLWQGEVGERLVRDALLFASGRRPEGREALAADIDAVRAASAPFGPALEALRTRLEQPGQAVLANYLRRERALLAERSARLDAMAALGLGEAALAEAADIGHRLERLRLRVEAVGARGQ